MILSHRYRFIYFSNGKAASTTFRRTLAPLHEGREYEGVPEGLGDGVHVTPGLVRQRMGPAFDDYFKFTFVRNPWDWFVSQLFHSARQRPDLFSPPGDGETLTTQQILSLVDYLKRFRVVESAPTTLQYYYAYDEDGTMLVDFVGRVETFDDSWAAVKRAVGLDIDLPHMNASDHRPYRSYYDAFAQRLVGEILALDVDAFGYAF